MEAKKNLRIEVPGVEIDENFQPKEKPSIERAKYFKDKGNNSFKYKDFKNAINYYDMALDTINDLERINKNIKEKSQEIIEESDIKEMKSTLYHNMSACHQGK